MHPSLPTPRPSNHRKHRTRGNAPFHFREQQSLPDSGVRQDGKDQVMASIVTKNMDSPDETRTPDKTSVSVVHLGESTVARMTLQPGWRWSECIKPVVGTESCQAAHLGYVVSGRIHIAQADGTEADLGAGDSYYIAPGHDAWVVGDEPFVGLEFESKTAETYAKT
jgi:hypothetical protein